MDDPKIVHPEFLKMWWDTYTANVLPLLEQHGIVKEITTGVNMVCALIFLYKLPKYGRQVLYNSTDFLSLCPTHNMDVV